MERTTSRRNRGFSTGEFSACMALVAMVVFGADWVKGAGDASQSSSGETRSQAFAIASGQSQVAQNIDLGQLAPSAEFAPAPWVHQPGFALGQVPVEMIGDGIDPSAAPEIYDVEVRVTNLDRSGHMQKVEVRVGYDRSVGDRAWVEMESVKAS